ncbi:MAG: Gfo/Idh/MocA family oxidoreductase [Ruminococcaceae bacterium]|nr:Gfo/Idh/MocA family oxidoreductase [Oscillospiraceae bacterium]
MKCVNVVLVGIGGYGNTFVREILEKTNSRINLTGVVDPYPERCSLISELKIRNIPVYLDMESFYKNNKADLAVISTPIFLHTQHILTALGNGSNVLCEKPLCSDEKDIEILKEAQKQSGKFIYIGYQWSYSEPITKLKRDIADGKYGELKEMKTLILRPRDRDYFGRGVGWAGKICTADGKKVYDSVANNSAAHYLFNMLFVMGKYQEAAEPTDVTAELLKANDIENFDVSKIQFKVDGKTATFIAAHPVNKTIEPVFEYCFEKGTVYYSSQKCDEAELLMPKEYIEYGNITALMHSGEKIVYGDPMADNCRKLHMAVDAIIDGKTDDGPCGIDAAAMHTKMINKIQKEFSIKPVKKALLKEKENLLYAEGLFEHMVEMYKDTDLSLNEFQGE